MKVTPPPALFAVADESFNIISSPGGVFPCGSSLKARFPALSNDIGRMLYFGERHIDLDGTYTLEYDGGCRVYVVYGDGGMLCGVQSFDEEYDRAVQSGSGSLLTSLYERAVSFCPRPYLRAVSEQPFLPIIDEFMNKIAPNLRTIRRGIVCRVGGSVDDGSAVLTERREFIIALAAMCAAVGFASRGAINIGVEHFRSNADICVSADIRTGIGGAGAALFGPRAADAVFAVHTLRALGHRAKIEADGGSVAFSLSARASAYHPSELKQRRGTLFTSLPLSANEQHREHDEQFVVGSAAEKYDDEPDEDDVLGAYPSEKLR